MCSPTPDFMLPHNQPITWDNMLRQDSRLDRHHVGQALVGGPARQAGKPWSELAKGPPPVGLAMEIQ